MYAQHVPLIAAYMRSSPRAFVRGAMFAVLSARMPFIRVPSQLERLEKVGEKSPDLFSWKLNAYRYIKRHAKQLLADCSQDDTRAALAAICKVPGMGLVKGGFVLQLMGHDVACLDTRNIQREERNPRAYRSDGAKHKTTKAFQRKLDRYLADVGGKAQHYWDVWCCYVGEQYKLTGHECSAIHLSIIDMPTMDAINVPCGTFAGVQTDDIPF